MEAVYQERRELVFLVLTGFFICSMTLLNVIGITRFVQLGPMQLAVGVLPYPLTFLCTDLVCELYGKRKANQMVTLGLILNLFILSVLYIGQLVPPIAVEAQPPWPVLPLAADVDLPNGTTASGSVELFQLIYATTSGAVFASMIAYIAAQYIDVRLFHFWKRLTKGKHLWLRNNFSTMTSQLVDSIMVILVPLEGRCCVAIWGLANYSVLYLAITFLNSSQPLWIHPLFTFLYGSLSPIWE